MASPPYQASLEPPRSINSWRIVFLPPVGLNSSSLLTSRQFSVISFQSSVFSHETENRTLRTDNFSFAVIRREAQCCSNLFGPTTDPLTLPSPPCQGERTKVRGLRSRFGSSSWHSLAAEDETAIKGRLKVLKDGKSLWLGERQTSTQQAVPKLQRKKFHCQKPQGLARFSQDPAGWSKRSPSEAAASEKPRRTLLVRQGFERRENKAGGLFQHPVRRRAR